MLKKLIFTIVFIVCTSLLDAQTMKWLCYPHFDRIEVLNERLYLVTKDSKYGILNNSGELIFAPEYDEVTPFQEGRALLIKTGSNGNKEIAGIIDEYGAVISWLEGLKYMPSASYPYFKEGKMVFADASKGGMIAKYGYLDLNGDVCIPAKFTFAAPFIDGKAIVKSAATGYFGVINQSGLNAVLINKPLLFLSSIVDGQAIGWRVTGGRSLLLRLKLEGDALIEESVISENYGQIKWADRPYSDMQYGPDLFSFDAALRYVGKNSQRDRSPIKNPSFPKPKSGRLSVIDDGKYYGVAYKEEPILLPWFKSVRPLRENVVAVKDEDGLTGLLYLDRNVSISFPELDKEFVLRSGIKPELAWYLSLEGIKLDDVDVLFYSDYTGDVFQPEYYYDYDGLAKLVISYDFPSLSQDYYMTDIFTAVVMVQGLPVKNESLAVSYVYAPILDEVNIHAPEFTDATGYADVRIDVSTYEIQSPSAQLIVRPISGEAQQISMDGISSASIGYRVSVPENEIYTFEFEVEVYDGDLCPSARTKVSATVKHYNFK